MNPKIYLPFLLFGFIQEGTAQESLTLSEAMQLARKENKQIQIQILETRKAEETIKEQRSFLLPEVSINTGYSFFAERPVIFLREQSSAQKVMPVQVGGRNATHLGLSATYPILQPALNSRSRLAGINAHAEQERTNDLTNEILFEVARTYYTVQFYSEQKALLQQSLKRNEHALADSRQLLQQGKGLKTDTIRNYIDVQNIRASIASLENKTSVEILHLQQLIGLKSGSSITLTDKLYDRQPVLSSLDSLISFAMEHRPDVKAQRLSIRYAKEEEQLAKAEFKPSVHAVAQYQLQSQSDQFNFWQRAFPRTSFVGIQLNVPIYAGRREKYRSALTHFSMHQQVLQLAHLKQRISVEITSLVERMKDAYLQKDIQDKNVDAAQINFNIVNDRYKHGISSRLELADAELILSQAKINQLHAVFVLKTLELELLKATGSLFID